MDKDVVVVYSGSPAGADIGGVREEHYHWRNSECSALGVPDSC